MTESGLEPRSAGHCLLKEKFEFQAKDFQIFARAARAMERQRNPEGGGPFFFWTPPNRAAINSAQPPIPLESTTLLQLVIIGLGLRVDSATAGAGSARTLIQHGSRCRLAAGPARNPASTCVTCSCKRSVARRLAAHARKAPSNSLAYPSASHAQGALPRWCRRPRPWAQQRGWHNKSRWPTWQARQERPFLCSLP